MKKEVAANIIELLEEERMKRAKAAIDALLEIYHNQKNSLPPEVVEICEKYLVGYWDVKIAKKTYKATKKKAAVNS